MLPHLDSGSRTQGAGLEGPPSRRPGPRLAIWALLLLTVAVYVPSLGAPMVLDDFDSIVDNPLIRDLGLFVRPSDAAAAGASGPQLAGFRTRPVAIFTFALNYRLHGLDVFGYHVLNLAIHLLAGMLLFRLVQRTLRLPCFRGSRLLAHETSIAWFTAALFLLHPIQTQAVTYIVQRMASLAAMLCLLAFVAYLEARTSARRGVRGAAYVLSVAALVAAMYTKQNVATFPLVLLLYELLFLAGALRRRLVRLLPHLATCAIAPWTLVQGSRLGTELLQAANQLARADSSLSRLEYLFTQFRVLVTYLRLLVWPAGQNLDYDYPVYRSLATLPVLLSLLLLLGLGGAAVALILRPPGREPGWRLVGFGVLWFYFALAVESSLLPIADVIFEHRLYLPSAGFFLAAVTALWLVTPARRSGVTLALLSVALLALATATAVRNRTWSSMISLWSDTAQKSPRKARVHYSLGGSYDLAGDRVAARREWETAIRLDPEHSWSLNSLGVLALEQRELAEAHRYFRRAVEAQNSNAEAHLNLGTVASQLGLEDEAILHLRAFLALTPDRGAPLGLRAQGQLLRIGRAAASNGEIERAAQAVAALVSLVAVTPDDPRLHLILEEVHRRISAASSDPVTTRLATARFLTSAAMAPEALAEARAALALAPDSIEVTNRVANLLSQNGAAEEAIALLRAATAKRPSDPILRNSLGIALRAGGRLREAADEYRRALAVDPDYAEAHYNLGNILRDLGELEAAIAEFEIADRLLPDNPVIRENLRDARDRAHSRGN